MIIILTFNLSYQKDNSHRLIKKHFKNIKWLATIIIDIMPLRITPFQNKQEILEWNSASLMERCAVMNS